MHLSLYVLPFFSALTVAGLKAACVLLARQGTCVCQSQSGQCCIVDSRHIVLLPVYLIQIGLFQIMSVRICLTCRSESLSFSDRILDCQPGEALEVGRADTLHRADTENAFFNCKVSLKVVMLLTYFRGCLLFIILPTLWMYARANPNLRHTYYVSCMSLFILLDLSSCDNMPQGW